MRLLDSASNVVIQGTCPGFVHREGEVVGVSEEEGVVVEEEVAGLVVQKGALSVGNLDTFLVNAQKVEGVEGELSGEVGDLVVVEGLVEGEEDFKIL